jgi:hypothetical protein
MAAPDVVAAFRGDRWPRHPGDVKARLLPGETVHAQIGLPGSAADCAAGILAIIVSIALLIASCIGIQGAFGRSSPVAGLIIGLAWVIQLAVSSLFLETGPWLVVTNQRLVYGHTGLFSRTQGGVPLEAVRAVVFASSRKTKTWGLGSLLVDTGDDRPALVLRGFSISSLNQDALPVRPAERHSGPAAAAARGLSDIAVAVAGRIAPRSRAEWMAEQVSAERLLPAAARLRFDCGLVKAAVIMRLSRVFAPLLARMDAVAQSWCSGVTGRRMPSCSCSGTRTRCCAGMPAGYGTSRATGCGSPRWHGCCRASPGPRSSAWRPRRC